MRDPTLPLAALVYQKDQDPDALLRDFAADLNRRGKRAVGLVQIGDQSGPAPQLSAMLVHSGLQVRLFQYLGPEATGCMLDVGQLTDAGAQVADALDAGADLVIINRFGRQEREGKGLSYLIERALSADVPVVIAVASNRLAAWREFAGALSVTLPCSRVALNEWWDTISLRGEDDAGKFAAESAKA
ncbi:hypothetical protein BH11PSE4_BH11PSE4_10650 [soil metagenome]